VTHATCTKREMKIRRHWKCFCWNKALWNCFYFYIFKCIKKSSIKNVIYLWYLKTNKVQQV